MSQTDHTFPGERGDADDGKGEKITRHVINDDELEDVELSTFKSNCEEVVETNGVEEEEISCPVVDKKINNSNKEETDVDDVDDDGWEDILGSGRIRKRVLKEGAKGSHLGRPNRSDCVKVSYKGWFQDKQFEDVDDVEFVASEGEVLQCIDLVSVLMNVGEICEVISDPEFAYGSVGLAPIVPPNAAIRLEIKLLSHEPCLTVSEYSLEDRMRIGKRKKDRGNFWFERKEYTFAVQCYRKAGEFLDHEDLDVPLDRCSLSGILQEILDERVKAYNNLAASQIKIDAWDSALASLQQVLKVEPNNEKALYRKSKVLVEKRRLDEAIGILRRVNRLYPQNILCKDDLHRLTLKQKSNLKMETNMSRKMLGLDKRNDEMKDSKSQKLSIFSKISHTGLLGVGVVVAGLASILYYSSLNANKIMPSF